MKAKALTVAGALDANRALKQFKADPDWMFKTGLGGMLTAGCLLVALLDLQHLLFVPVSLALAAVICGYLQRVIRLRVKEPEAAKMADWNDWADLFMAGITWITIQFGIAVFVSALISITLVITFYAIVTPFANSLAIAVCATLSIVLLLFWTHFFTTYLWVNFACEERVSGGLALRKVVLRVRQNPRLFFTTWALTCGLQTLAVVVPALTIVGLFLVPSTLFAAQLFSANILAQSWLPLDENAQDPKR